MLKRILSVLFLSVFVICLTGCKNNKPKKERHDGDSMFIGVESTALYNVSWVIMYHKDTKVMYMVTSRGPMVLVNADGSPMIYNP